MNALSPLPSSMPLGRKKPLAALLLLALLTGCAAAPEREASGPVEPPVASSVAGTTTVPGPGAEPQSMATSEEELRAVASTTATYDPFGRFNRAVYRFNARFDEAIHYPVARGYVKVVPQPVRTGIGNFFSNLGEVTNTANHLLQARPAYGARTAGRFLINSTVGVLGIFDVAKHLRMPAAPTSFANTLGRWGVGAGPYLVLPVLGPSSVRDGAGGLVDLGLVRAVDVGGLYSSDATWAQGTVYAVDRRARLAFRYYQSGSPFEYELMRFLFTRMRAIEISGAPSDGPVVVDAEVAAAAEAEAATADQLPVALPGDGGVEELE